ncbi:MAG: aminopeptidase [Archangium sp.]|nr:aminopeptidase [Archangium sp.]
MARSKSKHRRVQSKIRLKWKKRLERKKAATAAKETKSKKK